MRALMILSLLFIANVAAADPKPAKAARARSVATKPGAPVRLTCTRKVVGRGLERRVVCELAAPIIVKQDAPRPNVMIIDHGGRAVVGRPRSDDRLSGLSMR